MSTPSSVPCWRCGKDAKVQLAPLWGVHMDCLAATGCDGKNYRLVPAPGWPLDDPSGPHYAARLVA